MAIYKDASGIHYEMDANGFLHPEHAPSLALNPGQVDGLEEVTAERPVRRPAPRKSAAPAKKVAAKAPAAKPVSAAKKAPARKAAGRKR